jgi:hypothetical protein
MMKYSIELPDYWRKIDLKEQPSFHPVGASATAVNQERNLGYIFGGVDGSNQLNSRLYTFDMDSETIELHDELPIAGRTGHRMFYLPGEKLCIIGGFKSTDDSAGSVLQYHDEILLYDIKDKTVEAINIPEGMMARGQFTAAFDNHTMLLYIFGGFNNDSLYSFDTVSYETRELDPAGDKLTKRAGMISEVLPSGDYFIFSGFQKVNNRSVCHNDYYLYTPSTDRVIQTRCSEQFGRTFAKSFLCPKRDKVLFYGGSYNGMEGSGAIYFYDYKDDCFNRLYVESLPGERVEATVLYSEKNDLLYVIAGLKPDGMKGYHTWNEVMVLDFTLIDEDAWTGHP